MADKFCSNCKRYDLFNDEEPCLTCDGDNGRHINWQPLESNEPCESALDAARRAGKAEGLREAAEIAGKRVLIFKEIDVLETSQEGLQRAFANMLIARAEEVERE